jgi:uncharacterized glyoxalase superfamily protein PhnB
MSDSAPPLVECEQVHAGLAVNDIATAIEFYTSKLGFTTGFTWGDPPTFAGVNLGKVQMFLRKGTPDPKGCVVYFLVCDADQLYEFHRGQGVEVAEPIEDRPYGIRNYVVRDLHGHCLFLRTSPVQLRLADQNRAGRRSCASREASCRPPAGFGQAQAHERGQLPRGDTTPCERGCRTPHTNDARVYPGFEEEARNRLRLARQLPIC